MSEEKSKIINMIKDVQEKVMACANNNIVSSKDMAAAKETCSILDGLIAEINSHDFIPADVENDIAEYKAIVDEVLKVYASE